ncbi:MAG: hypothetical protein HZC54_00805 [Verrucomicrobia bacterium]|nr:hypothetical protein [Verrucomicrobiota bacterium]
MMTDAEKQQVKARFDAIEKELPGLKFKPRYEMAVQVLPLDRRPATKHASPYLLPWLGVSKLERAKPGRKPKAPAAPASAAAAAPAAGVNGRDRMMDALEFMGQTLVDLVATQIAIRFEATGARFQERTAAAETQLRKLRDVRRELIEAKAKGDASRADALAREMENLQAWAATGPRAAAEVGA